VYVPNGQSLDSDKYQYKLKWLAALHRWLADELKRYPKLALLGDYNIAPEDRDLYDPVSWAGNVLVSEPERAAFQALLQLGLHDSFRLFEQTEKSYSWWDYRMMAFRRNMGLRIDHILISDALLANCTSCVIDKAPRKLERPSDHTPVITEIQHVA
jgi:exodeoxyribonuclease-3